MSVSRVPLASLPNGTILVEKSYVPASGATAFVYEHGTTKQVTIYAQEAGSETLTQPLITNSSGQLPGYVLAEQDLDVTATFSGHVSGPAEMVALRAQDLVSGRVAPSGDLTGVTDTATINAALQAYPGLGATVLTGDYYVNKPIRIPSHGHLLLLNAAIHLTAKANCNIITNSNLAEGNTNCYATGIGRASIDGNGTNQERQAKPWENIGILFNKTKNYAIRGLQVGPTQFWGMSIQLTEDGVISDIHFEQDKSSLNQDGIDVFQGNKRILIENLTGVTNDDAVAIGTQTTQNALTCCPTPGAGGEVADIVLRNIRVETTYNTLRFLNGDGQKMTRISASGLSNPTLGKAMVIFGPVGYVTTPPTPEECSHISISDIKGAAGEAILKLEQAFANLRVSGVSINGTWPVLVEGGALSFENLSVRDIRIKAGYAGTVMKFVGGANMRQIEIEGLSADVVGTIFNNAGTVTRGHFKNFNIDRLTQHVINSSTAEGGTLDGVQIATFEGAARYAGAAPKLTFGPLCPGFTSADTTPVATLGSYARCDHTKVLDGGTEKAALYMGDGTVWNRMLSLANG